MSVPPGELRVMAVPLVSGPGLGDANAARKSTGTLPENQCDFDKVNHSLYNAFYQPFDEGIFVDTNYEVDTRNATFILTSNFAAEAEIKQGLGTAMYSRIGACIAFDDLPVQARQAIAQRHFDEVYGCIDSDDKAAIDSTDIGAWLQANAERYDNMRIMKTKIDRAIFGHLTDRLLSAQKPNDEQE